MCVEVFGADNVMYGSDYPHTIGDMPGCLSRVDALKDPVRNKVRGENAKTIRAVGAPRCRPVLLSGPRFSLPLAAPSAFPRDNVCFRPKADISLNPMRRILGMAALTAILMGCVTGDGVFTDMSKKPVPPAPEGWNKTLADLMDEVTTGKRKSLGSPEIDWARDYERSLLPVGTRFPQRGDLYEVTEAVEVTTSRVGSRHSLAGERRRCWSATESLWTKSQWKLDRFLSQ